MFTGYYHASVRGRNDHRRSDDDCRCRRRKHYNFTVFGYDHQSSDDNNESVYYDKVIWRMLRHMVSMDICGDVLGRCVTSLVIKALRKASESCGTCEMRTKTRTCLTSATCPCM